MRLGSKKVAGGAMTVLVENRVAGLRSDPRRTGYRSMLSLILWTLQDCEIRVVGDRAEPHYTGGWRAVSHVLPQGGGDSPGCRLVKRLRQPPDAGSISYRCRPAQ